MIKQGCQSILIFLAIMCLFGCVGSLWTGAKIVYDRHDVYKKLDDYRLYVKVNDVLAVDKPFKSSDCVLDIAVFNGDILLAGHLPTPELLDELNRRLAKIKGYRRLFNEVQVSNAPSRMMQDSWITTKIRSQIFADDSIDPNAFKVITTDGVVYLMGDVLPAEAATVVNMARHTTGVLRVVKVLKYFTYQQ